MLEGFYGEGSIGPGSIDSQVGPITQSGFDTVIFGLFHIGRPTIAGQSLGDVIYNDKMVAHDGALQTGYVADWATAMAKLKQGGVAKLYMSFGGEGTAYNYQPGPVWDYSTIMGFTDQQGVKVGPIMRYESIPDPANPGQTISVPYIPSDSDLYKNFQVLRAAFPDIDGIDIDQEEVIGSASDPGIIDAMTAFGKMAFAVGFDEVTFAPPGNANQYGYTAAAEAINRFAANPAGYAVNPGDAQLTPRKGVVTRLGLQVYGAVGDPAAFKSAATSIGAAGGGADPVLLIGANANGSDPASIQQHFFGYAGQGYAGGFIWRYTFIQSNPSAFHGAIVNGLSGKS